jgi:hypothetical protein
MPHVGRHRLLAAVALLALAGCGGAAGPGTTPSSTATSQPVSAAPSSSTGPSAAASPSQAASPWPATSATPSVGLNPERCPPTLPPDLYRTADGTQIDGPPEFIAHVEKALNLLKDKAPEPYAAVVANVTTIWSVDSFSGMCYDTGTYRVGDETAHAPGYQADAQVVWLAGTIVHDGCHRARFVEGQSPTGRDAELDCLQRQFETLGLIEGSATRFAAYVKTLIDGADDPANQYWNSPSRHW